MAIIIVVGGSRTLKTLNNVDNYNNYHLFLLHIYACDIFLTKFGMKLVMDEFKLYKLSSLGARNV